MSEMARGHMARAWRAQPFGVVLFPAAVVLAAAGALELATGRDAIGRLRPRMWWLTAGLLALFAGWGVKMLTGYLSGQYPIR
jgi:hypothetical protein